MLSSVHAIRLHCCSDDTVDAFGGSDKMVVGEVGVSGWGSVPPVSEHQAVPIQGALIE